MRLLRETLVEKRASLPWPCRGPYPAKLAAVMALDSALGLWWMLRWPEEVAVWNRLNLGEEVQVIPALQTGIGYGAQAGEDMTLPSGLQMTNRDSFRGKNMKLVKEKAKAGQIGKC